MERKVTGLGWSVHGASEQYMWRVTSSLQVKGWLYQKDEGESDDTSELVLLRRNSEDVALSSPAARRLHSWRRK